VLLLVLLTTFVFRDNGGTHRRVFSAYVSREVAGLRERSATDGTLVRTLARVHTSVTYKCGTVDERQRAERADEWTNGRNESARHRSPRLSGMLLLLLIAMMMMVLALRRG